MSETDAPFSRRQLSEEVASYVRELIVSGRLQTGQFIRQERIAEELQLSATPVREGLLTLQGEGFVELKPRRGFAVARLTVADVRDLFTAQALLAGELAARAATRIGEEDLRQLTTIHKELREAATAEDGNTVASLNHEFHARINAIADAPRLVWILSIASRFAPRRYYASVPALYKASARNHAAVLKALKNRDSEQARLAMTRHMENMGRLLAASFKAAQQPGEAAGQDS